MTWASRQGETFLGDLPKWLPAMLRRAQLDPDLYAAYQALLRETPIRADDVANRCRALFVGFGVDDAWCNRRSRLL